MPARPILRYMILPFALLSCTGGTGDNNDGPSGLICAQPEQFDQACETPSDCAVVTYNHDCCGGGSISAVHNDVAQAFTEAQAPCRNEILDCPPVGCSAPMVADDGNEVSGPSQVNTVCESNLCRTVAAF